jgi:glutamine amidotransferase
VVTIVDVGIGNLRSVQKAFERVGAVAERTRDPARIDRATHLVLPGVGAFGDFMAALRAAGLVEPLVARARERRPLLGICVGMQALYEESEEFGRHQGLGIVPGRVARFPAGPLPVPHSGWSQVHGAEGKPDPLLGPALERWFYFVHSYRAEGVDPSTTVGLARYGHEFPAACRRGACWGVQFHPEKSQTAGLELLSRFAGLPLEVPA